MIHPDTRLTVIDEVTGVGIVATKAIPKGTITWCRDPLDIVLSAGETSRLSKKLRDSFLKFAYRTDHGEFVLNWDNGRYQNHSCRPTSCLLPNFDCEIALRNINVGEQISSDYATYNISDGFSCSCKAPGCRSTIMPSHKEACIKALTPAVEEALQCFLMVDQPLKHISEYFPNPDIGIDHPKDSGGLAEWYHSFGSRRGRRSE